MIFELVTPERVLAREVVKQVTLPTSQGEITILPNHAPLVTLLSPGIIHVVHDNREEDVAVSGGFIEISQNRIRVLADTAERGEELDISVIEAAKERARKLMTEAVRLDDNTYAAAAAALERELAREKVVRKTRKSRHVPTLDAANLPPTTNST